MEAASPSGDRLSTEISSNLYKTHLQGALVRSGASLFMGAFALFAFYTGTIKAQHLAGIGLSILFLIVINPPILWFLKKTESKSAFRFFSLFINFLEIIGYTAVIYFAGGIQATHLTPIYAALITYVGAVAPRRFPFVVAAMCAIIYAAMAILEHVGYLPHQYVLSDAELAVEHQLVFGSVVMALLFITAYISSFTAGILKKGRDKLHRKNIELQGAIRKSEDAERQVKTAHDELEKRVEKRTLDLARVNEELEAEISERKLVETALRKSEEKYRDLVENISDIIYATDDQYNLTYISPLIEAETGFRASELMGKSFFDFVHPDDAARLRRRFQDAFASSSEADQYRLLTKSGEERWMRFSSRPLSEGNRIAGFRGILTDVTEQKHLESRLRQAQKMEAIGALAGGIAHDFNNILSPIVAYSEMAMMALPPDSPIQQDLGYILKAGERAKDLVKQILTFARRREEQKIPLKTSLIVKEAVKFLRSTVPATIDIRMDIKAKRDTVLADPTRMNEVVMNLCTNATQAMREKGGLLTISLANEHIGTDGRNRFADLDSGHHLRMSVSDSGPGIAPEILDKVFEPYFTTKGPGEGTGLGLAIIHGIVQDAGGHVTVESALGEGTTFHVWLPVIEAEVPLHTTVETQIPQGKERVLFVDDEKTVVGAMRSMLERLGYQVTARANSSEALETFRDDPDGIDLVITDMTMPSMTGKELARRLRSIRPDIPVILCTGFSDQIDETSSSKIGIDAFLLKPIGIKVMADTIRELLDKRH